MKSLFSRFNKQPGASLPQGAPGSRSSVHLDEKDKSVREHVKALEASDATLRVKSRRASLGGSRLSIPPSHRPGPASYTAATQSSISRAEDRIGLQSPGPSAPSSLPPSSSISAARQPQPRPSSRASAHGPNQTASTSASARARGISITSGTSASSSGVSRRGGHSRTTSSATTSGIATSAQPLTDISEWGGRGPSRRISLDNVKKQVAFQSPARNVNASESDLRATARSAMMGSSTVGPSRSARRTSSPPRTTSAAPMQSNVQALSHIFEKAATSTNPIQPRATLSRSSSRQSLHNRKASLTGSGSIMHSPSKTALSTLAPSENSSAGYLPMPECWSAAMDDELIANLGPRERARQEVLWEIVNSEEKYVQDLIKLNETFCRQLLPAPETRPNYSLPDPLALSRIVSPVSSSGNTDEAHLPIAAQYSRFSADSFRDVPPGSFPSPEIPQGQTSDSAREHAYKALTKGTNRHSVHEMTSTPVDTDKPLPRLNRASAGYKRLSFHRTGSTHSRITSRSSISSVLDQNGPVTLPDDLEQVLTVISSGILDGHIKMVTALRQRYDDQFPLVRSLADVFTSHSEILREYATYILHLERALAQVDEALTMAGQIATGGRRSSRRLEETQLGKLSKLLAGLEELAAERGEAGLAIALSKPFQRLLKYPLLFQNLLYNTSPSTREYEATLAMVDEVQRIVRSIEDEKSSSEERDKANDAWARIDGMVQNKLLMAPKPNRLLVSETSVASRSAAPVKERKRLSELLKGKQAEQWIVKFSDVSLLCELTGTTTLPFTTKPKTETDTASKRMSGMKQKNGPMKARNTYKFLKVHEWHEVKTSQPVQFVIEKPRRTLSDLAETQSPSKTPMKTVPLKTGDETPSKLTPRRRPGSAAGTYDDAMSDKVSVMSFAFRGEARPNRLAAATRAKSPQTRLVPRAPISHERRASTAGAASQQAKFGHRLRASDDVTVRPASRVRRSLPPAMALTPTNVNGRSSPVRPPWNGGTRAASARDFSGPTSRGIIRPKTSAGAIKDTTAVETTATTSASKDIGVGIWEERPGLSAATAARIARRNLGGHI